MKIEIITVYNSYNFGSYLQAKNLYTALSQYGQVKFLDFHQRKMLRPCLSRIKRGLEHSNKVYDRLKVIKFELQEFIVTKISWMKLKRTMSISYGDVFILGSDEIWNIKRPTLQDSIYWGCGISGKIISYAPSINNATFDDFDFGETRKRLDALNRISVRDTYSKSVLGRIVEKEIVTVLDPTLLYDPKIERYKPLGIPYIAVYVFGGKISAENIEGIVSFAKKHNLKLVTAGISHSWCDYSVNSIDADPFWIYKDAEFVITNTFHGTAFAINHRKRFVTFADNNLKIHELLSAFKLEELAYDGSSLEKQFNYDFPNETVNRLLNQYREESFHYIKNALGLNDENGLI